MASPNRANTSNLGAPTSAVDRVYREYVGVVSRLSFVRASGIDYANDGGHIWTVIDADPEDRAARERIYEAELLASDIAPDAEVSFRLVNQREYSSEALIQLLPVIASHAQQPATNV